MLSRRQLRFASASLATPVAVLLTAALVALAPSAQAQTVLWSKNHGGPYFDGAMDVTQTADGGYILTGHRGVTHGVEDIYLLRADGQGNEVWSRTFPGPFSGWGSEVVELPNGDFLAAGVFEVNPQTHDAWAVRTDPNGNPLWIRQYDAGIGDDDRAHGICPTADGGFILAGQAYLPEPPFGNYDVYVVKCDAQGNRLWQRFFKYELEAGDVALAVAQTPDGGYLIGGFTHANAIWAAYVIRTDPSGNRLWQQTYRFGDFAGEANDLQLTADGGFILTGPFMSDWIHDTDFGLVKCDAAGNVQWQRVYGGTESEDSQQVTQTRDGGYLVAGHTSSYGMGGWDGYVLRTDPTGQVLWNHTFGADSDDRAWSVEQTEDGDVVVAGWVWSTPESQWDLHLRKLDDPVTVAVADYGAPPVAGSLEILGIAPNPFTERARFDVRLPAGTRGILRIVDVSGREVSRIEATTSNPLTWDGRDSRGARVAPGIYFSTLSAGGRTVSEKLTLLPR
jgi:hypothetical protein